MEFWRGNRDSDLDHIYAIYSTVINLLIYHVPQHNSFTNQLTKSSLSACSGRFVAHPHL